jgi:hypothetical protein
LRAPRSHTVTTTITTIITPRKKKDASRLEKGLVGAVSART